MVFLDTALYQGPSIMFVPILQKRDGLVPLACSLINR